MIGFPFKGFGGKLWRVEDLGLMPIRDQNLNVQLGFKKKLFF